MWPDQHGPTCFGRGSTSLVKVRVLLHMESMATVLADTDHLVTMLGKRRPHSRQRIDDGAAFFDSFKRIESTLLPALRCPK